MLEPVEVEHHERAGATTPHSVKLFVHPLNEVTAVEELRQGIALTQFFETPVYLEKLQLALPQSARNATGNPSRHRNQRG
jgi:hypothetical protein